MTERRRTYEELEAICTRLEERAGEHLVLQRDLMEAKARVDDELARFRAIQTFIERSLNADTEETFHSIAMEAVIEAFQFEVALCLRVADDGSALAVAGSFGFEDPPTVLPFDEDWIDDRVPIVVDQRDPMLLAWRSLGLQDAIICPLWSGDNELNGLVVGGRSIANRDRFEPITAEIGAAFTVMARQIGSVHSNRQLNLELRAQNRRLEVEHARQIVMQRDLIRAKDQVDDELMRFKSFQEYIAKTLDAESDDAFYQLTLEAIIEAFELEVAVFLRVDENHAQHFKVAARFGLDDAPASLPFEPEWFANSESRTTGNDSPLATWWPGLSLATAIVCPFLDRKGRLGGAILAGVTVDSMDFYEEIKQEIRVPFSVLVRQAGGLWINRQLNAQVLAQNERLANLTRSYSRFVPFQFLDLLGRSSIEEIATGDSVLRTMSVLFADIRGFTTLSEHLGPSEIFVALNEFLATMEPLIAHEEGFINQYLGDAIMALFPGSADAALRCAEAMLQSQTAFNEARQARGERPIFFGLGINSGPLMVGALGGGERLDSNVIGDTANLASRVEGLTKIYGVPAIFTEATRTRLEEPEALRFREIDRVMVKGRGKATTIYELIPQRSDTGDANANDLAEAMGLYRAGDFETAKARFQDCAARVDNDPLPRLYIQRCDRFLQAPPSFWDGVWRLDEKR